MLLNLLGLKPITNTRVQETAVINQADMHENTSIVRRFRISKCKFQPWLGSGGGARSIKMDSVWASWV